MKLTRYRPAGDQGSWAPFDQLTTLRDEINRLFEPAAGQTTATQFFNVWSPPLDLYEDKDHLLVKVELPGMKKEEIDISLHEGILCVSGERKPDPKYEKADAYRSERFDGRFQRSLALPKPVNADAVSATYQDGILTVTLPKTEEAKPRQIEVNVG